MQAIASSTSGKRVGGGMLTLFMTDEAKPTGARTPAKACINSWSTYCSSDSSNAMICLLYHRSELFPRPVEIRFHRAQRQIQQPRDLFVRPLLHIEQHHHLPVILGQ